MGLFSKKQPSDAESKQQAASEPFVADDQTVARVAELMKMFNDAVGNDAMMRATASGISSAAGVTDQFLMSGAWVNNPTLVAERPWQMLAAVALRAAQNTDHFLVARIFGFISFWGTQIAPHLGPADWFDMRLDKAPPAIEAEIATVALGSLQRLSGDWIIFSNDTGSITAGNLTILAASVLVHAPEQGISVDESALAAARSIVG